MNLTRDLQKLKKEKQMKESAIAQLRKRSKDSGTAGYYYSNQLYGNTSLADLSGIWVF